MEFTFRHILFVVQTFTDTERQVYRVEGGDGYADQVLRGRSVEATYEFGLPPSCRVQYEALELVDALKNAADDSKHEKEVYHCLVFETLRGKLDQPSDQFRNFIFPLLAFGW